MSRSRRSFQKGGPEPVGLEFAATLLPLWGFPAGAAISPADEQGTNNRTFLVRHGQQRYVLRVSGFLSVAEVRAEHQILSGLRQGGLPFQVPEPVAAPDGQTVIGTPAGPATISRWLPGVRPDMNSEAAFERFGRTAGVLGAALADVPLADTLRDWRTDPRWVQPDDPPVDVVCGELRTAGMSARQAEVLGEAGRRIGRWWPGADGLPAQVIHADLAPSNVLADPDTGQVTGLLGLRGGRGRLPGCRTSWPRCISPPRSARRTGRAAQRPCLRGYASVRRLEPAEVAAMPELLIARSLGSVLWRAARWRAGIGHIGEVTAHVGKLEAITGWLAANQDAFLAVAASAGQGGLRVSSG